MNPSFSSVDRHEAAKALIAKYWVAAALSAVLVLAIVLRTYDLGGNPPGFFADEASYGYNAYSILHSGRDEHGKLMPLFFEASGEYKLPVFTYSQIPFVAVFGLTETAVRLTAATYGVLTILAAYLLVRSLSGRRGLGLAAAATLAILPWHIFYSRAGFAESITFVFYLTLSLYLFHAGTRRPALWLAAAVAFALTLYSYRSAWVTVPPLLLVIGVLYYRELMKHWRLTLAGVLILAAATVPIILQLLSVDTDRARDQSILGLDLGTLETVRKFLGHYRSHFEISFLFQGEGSGNLRHEVPGSGFLYWWQAPFLLLGLLALLWKPSRPKLLVLGLLLVYPLGTSVTQGSPGSNRSIVGSLAFALITAYGVVATANSLVARLRPRRLEVARIGAAGVLLGGAAVVVAAGLVSFLDTYHGSYARVSAGYQGWQAGPRDIVRHFVSIEEQYDELIMDGSFNAAYIFLDFYAPGGCEKCTIGDAEAYDPSQRQLFALRPGGLWPTHEYQVEDALYYPDGSLAFVFVEITGRRVSMPGNAPLERLGAPSLSISDLDDEIARHPDAAWAYNDRGVIYWNEGKLRRARHNLDKANELAPREALLHYNRGTVHATRGAYDQALGDLAFAIMFDPAMAEAYNNRGAAYAAQGNHEEAIADFNQATELEPVWPLAYENRGLAYLELGDGGRALEDFDRAVDLDPASAAAHDGRGRALLLLGAREEAMASFNRAVELDASYAAPHAGLAAVFMEQGDYGRAVAEFDRATALGSDVALNYAHRGVALLNLADIERGLADLEKAMQLDRMYGLAPPGTGNPAWTLGDALEITVELENLLLLTTDDGFEAQITEIIGELKAGPHPTAPSRWTSPTLWPMLTEALRLEPTREARRKEPAMTTREQLIDGLQMIVREGLRTTASFSPDGWDYKVHTEEGGWTAKQLYCHLAATAELLPVLAGNLSQVEESQNAAAGIDIDALNAQGVATREQLAPKELMESFEAAHGKAIEFLKGFPDDQLQQRRRFGPVEAPVADLIQTFFVLHGLAHVYHAQSRPLS